uniref:Uncharacterized protein n=1 Tax=Xenopus tropicalis TaxID=8364 RepID=A0A1B8XX31_XENTR
MADSSVEPASPSNSQEMRSVSGSLESELSVEMASQSDSQEMMSVSGSQGSGDMDYSQNQDTDGAESKDCETTGLRSTPASDGTFSARRAREGKSLDKENRSQDGNKVTQIIFINQINNFWSRRHANQGEKNHPKRRHGTANEESESKRKKPTRSPLRDTGSNARENAS